MSTTQQPDVLVTVTPVASVEVKKFMDAENVDPARGGLRVSVQPGGCSGFKYGLLIEDEPAEDDLVVDQGGWKVFVEQPIAERLVSRGVYVTQHPRNQSGDRINNHDGSGLPAGKSVVADGKFVINERLYPFIDALITAADEDDFSFFG